MVVDTIKENICVNKLVATKKEIIMIEGDMIVPDSKPDILNTICTSGVVCVYKKEVLDDKIRIDGNINTYIMYMAEDETSKVRGLTANLDFSENLQVLGAKEGMVCILETKLKSIEGKIINGRKVSIKAAVEISIKLYSNEEVQIVNDMQDAKDIKILKRNLAVNSLVGSGETKIYAKDTIRIDNIDNLVEVLRANVAITDRDIKISYNKILTKAEAEVKIMYLTEDNRINTANARIPVVGFVDVEGVTEGHICDVTYEIKNMVLKLNTMEEHSVYIEIEVGIMASVFEEKEINLIQDLYSPSEKIEFGKKKIIAVTNKKSIKEVKQIREKIKVDGLDNRTIIDVDVTPIVENEIKTNNRIVYEGAVELEFVLANNDLQVDTVKSKIPFDYSVSDLEDGENTNNNINIEITNQDFIIQDGGIVSVNLDLNMNSGLYRSSNMDIIDEIQSIGEREEEDYNIVMYIVKKGDTLWEIAKRFGSTVEDITIVNGIEDENTINVGQKLFVPRYKKSIVMNYV